MKRGSFSAGLGILPILMLVACSGADGGGDAPADVHAPDATTDQQGVDAAEDPGWLDLPADPGEPTDTIEPVDPGESQDPGAPDATSSDLAEDTQAPPPSLGCIGCHTNQAVLKVLAPDDGTEPAGGGG